MKRMWSKNELKSIADTQAKAVQKDISTLVDSQGHPRFFEEDIEIATISGVTKTYGKLSLAATHLMIVLCLDLANGTAVNNGVKIADLNLPAWVVEKVSPIFGGVVDNKNFPAYSSDYSQQSFAVYLSLSDGTLKLQKNNNITLDKDRSVRIQFDLLIDAD